MKIPWKIKSLAFRVLSYLPANALYFVQRHVTQRARVDIREVHAGWRYHANIITETGAQTVIEFGAGKTLAQNLFLSPLVDRQTVVDLFPMLEFAMVNQSINQLRALNVALDGRHVSNLGELQEIYGIDYQAPFDMRTTQFADDSFDICISTNTLEHIPTDDITKIFKELYRVLKPGGAVSAMIDYSDHYAHSDPAVSRLHYLQFNDRKWAPHNHPNHYQNRLRHGHYRRIFQDVGFVIERDEPTDFASPNGLDFHPELLTGNAEDFSTTGFWLLKKRSTQ